MTKPNVRRPMWRMRVVRSRKGKGSYRRKDKYEKDFT